MRRFFILLLLVTIPAGASEYSKFAEKNYASQNCLEKVHITVKKEYKEPFAQEIGDKFVPYIVYGFGDLKSKGHKKKRITYTCLLNMCLKPFWSDVYESQ